MLFGLLGVLDTALAVHYGEAPAGGKALGCATERLTSRARLQGRGVLFMLTSEGLRPFVRGET